jgi:hypothetical protein
MNTLIMLKRSLPVDWNNEMPETEYERWIRMTREGHIPEIAAGLSRLEYRKKDNKMNILEFLLITIIVAMCVVLVLLLWDKTYPPETYRQMILIATTGIQAMRTA